MVLSEDRLVHESATSRKRAMIARFVSSELSSAILDAITAAVIAMCQASSRKKKKRKRTTTNGGAASPIITISRKKSIAAGTHAIAMHQAVRSVTKRETA